MNKQVVLCNAGIKDVDAIKKIADANKKELGFIVRPIFEASAEDGELLIAKIGSQIVGFLRWHHRLDGWNTLYDICVEKNHRGRGIGKRLMNRIPKPKRGKCPIDNESNGFHRHIGGIFTGREKGRKRKLNVYTWT